MTRPGRRSSRARRLVPAAAAALAAVAAAGCGTGGVDRDTNTSGGKALFVAKCGGCHTLADAGTTGKVGPDLDAAFAPSRKQGFSESTVRQVVIDQIHYPSPAAGNTQFPVMPADLVTGSDADAVAAYIASVAGVGGPPSPAPPGPPPPPPPLPTTSQTTTSATTTAPAPGPSGGDAAKGKSLYASLGCTSCHSIDGSNGVGPTFKGLYGSQVKLTNGKTVSADDAYLLESIEDPDAEIVQGYQPGVMTGVIKPHQVSESDANDLITYIKSLK